MITVVVKLPGFEPEVQEIEASLESMQKLVGGYIEHVYIAGFDLDLFCNEEGKLERLASNLRTSGDIVVGPVFISATDDAGEARTLTEDETKTAIGFLRNAAI